MKKSELRKKYKSLRQDLSQTQIEDFSLDIANQLLKLDVWNFSCYHIFLSIEEQKEINTDYILNILAGKDKNIVISKSNFEDYSMKHFLLTDNTKIKKLTGFKPQVDISEGLQRTIDWFTQPNHLKHYKAKIYNV